MKPSRLQNVLKSFGRAPKCIKILWPDSKIHEILENSCEFLRNFLIFCKFCSTFLIFCKFCKFLRIFAILCKFCVICLIFANFAN